MYRTDTNTNDSTANTNDSTNANETKMTNTAAQNATPRTPQPSNATPTKQGETARAGTLEWRRGKARLRLSLGSFGRRMLTLATCTTKAKAEERRALLVRLADRLVASGQVVLGFPLLEAAAARDGRALEAVETAIERVANGDTRPKTTGEATIRQIGERWTSGDLASEFPDQARPKKSGSEDAGLFERYVYPYVGEVPIARFTLAHGMAVMGRIPSDRAPQTRRHVAQAMRKLLAYAVFPLQLRSDNPLDIPHFLPRLGSRKLKSYLYPAEDRALLGCAAVPLKHRVLYAFLAREGMRASEAASLTWADLDLKNGLVTLAKNKTNDPRSWPLRPDVVRALRALKKRAAASEGAAVFAAHPQPKHLRKHLDTAGIKRPVLFRGDDTYQAIRVHDLRATFVTVSLANGATEDWVMRRTGHRSSVMVQLYRRGSQNAADVNLGDFAPMDAAIPELAGHEGDAPPDSGAAGYSPGTAPRDTSRDVASEIENHDDRSVSRHVESPNPAFESSNRGSNPRTGTTGLTAEPSRGNRPPSPTAASAPHEAPYQIRTSRAAAVGRLAGELASLAADGDLEGARAVHETIGRLLAPVARAGEGAARGAVVVDLAAERARAVRRQ